MPISFQCPNCGKSYTQPDAAAGRIAKCPCGQQITVPQPLAGPDEIPELTDADLARPSPAIGVPQQAVPQPMAGTPQGFQQPGYGQAMAEPQSPGQPMGPGNPAQGQQMPGGAFGGGPSGKRPLPKWVLPSAIAGGVGVVGIVVLVIVLISGGDDDNVQATNAAGNGAANAQSGEPTRGETNNAGNTNNGANASTENDFASTLPDPNWSNQPLDSFPELDQELSSKLGWFSGREIDVMVSSMSHDNAKARVKAMEGIYFGELTDEQVVPHREQILNQAIANLNHSTPDVRSAAAMLVAEFGEDANEALIPLAVMLRHGESDAEKSQAAQTLIALGEAARPAVSILVETALATESAFCASSCCEALGRLNCHAELKQLSQLRQGGLVGNEALGAMGWLRPVPEEELQQLFRMAESGDYYSGATAGLGGLAVARPTTERIINAFRQAMESDDNLIRYTAGEALMTLDTAAPGYQELLNLALADDDLRHYGEQALARTDGDESARLSTLLSEYESNVDDSDLSFRLSFLQQSGLAALNALVESPDELPELRRCYAAYFLAKNVRDHHLRDSDEELSADDLQTFTENVDTWKLDEQFPLSVRASLAIGRHDVLTEEDTPQVILDGLVGECPIEIRAEIAKWMSEKTEWVQEDHCLGPLTQALSDREGMIASHAAKALSNFGAAAVDAIPELHSAAEVTDLPERFRIIDAIGDIGDPSGESVDLLLPMLASDGDPDVRHSCAMSLGQLAAQHADRVDEILAALRDRFAEADAFDRHGIAQGYGFMGSAAAAAVEDLAELLNAVELTDEYSYFDADIEDEMLQEVVRALGEIRARADAAAPALARVLDDARLQRGAHQALRAFGADAAPAVPMLIEHLSAERLSTLDEDSWPNGIILTLEAIGPAAKDALPALEALRGRAQADFPDFLQSLDEAIAAIRGV